MASDQEKNGRKYDLEERLIDFTLQVIEIVEALPQTRVGNHVAGQFLRRGTSAAPNEGEPRGAESRKDFVHKMKVVLKELRQVRVWLLLIHRKGLLRSRDQLARAQSECDELISIFVKSISTAERGLA